MAQHRSVSQMLLMRYTTRNVNFLKRAQPLFSQRFFSSCEFPPLRILFAGSDDFSSASLTALYKLHCEDKSLIRSIDLLCREDGRIGRKLDVIKEVPIKNVGRSLGLRTHNISTFEDFKVLPSSSCGKQINMIVAVSFGLFIPAEVINSLQFGGLNVHPSLLPMYRGAAPIHHTIINKTPISGVSVQTLHPENFDRGDILLQSNPPILLGPQTTFRDLRDNLALLGAQMLTETIKKRLYLSPVRSVKSPYPSSVARKLSTNDKRIDWQNWSAQELQQRSEIHGSLWTYMEMDSSPHKPKRTILSGIRILERHPGIHLEPGFFRYHKDVDGDVVLALRCRKGWVSVEKVQFEGRRTIDGREWVTSVEGRGIGKRFR